MKVGDLVKIMISERPISFALALQEAEPPAQWAEDYIHDGWWEVLIDGEFDVWPEHLVEVISESH
jgi:hypothetical protein